MKLATLLTFFGLVKNIEANLPGNKPGAVAIKAQKNSIHHVIGYAPSPKSRGKRENRRPSANKSHKSFRALRHITKGKLDASSI